MADFGGHAAACGLKIMRENLDKFRTRLNMVASGILSVDDLVPSLTIDIEIPFHALKQKLIWELEALSPFGPRNPRPIFSSRSIRLKSRPKRIRREGIKMLLTDNNITCEAIGFGMSDMLDDILESTTVDIAYTPSINNWRGVNTLQLELVDVKANLI